MKANLFISIGKKGTSLPLGLHKIIPPLVIGENLLRWAGRGSYPQAMAANGWVSENRHPFFELYPLDQAIQEKRIVHVSHIAWIAEADGKHYEGEAFFPKDWNSLNPKQPQLVAVRSEKWPHGCVQRDRSKDGRNASSIARFEWSSMFSKAVAQPRRAWTKDELLVALNLYHKLNFGQFHARQPVIIEVARKLGRTPDSLAMKLGNLASLDPALQLRGIKGLEGASVLDKEMWQEFHEKPGTMAVESEEIFRRLFQVPDEEDIEIVKSEGVKLRKRTFLIPTMETEILANVKVRRGQQFFRQVVLNNFDERCSITAIGIRELLIASHILPWRDYPDKRLDVRNGICLSRLHDAAFDQGLITFDDELRLVLSAQLKKVLPHPAIESSFAAYEGQALLIPEDAEPPNLDYLSVHRLKLFRG